MRDLTLERFLDQVAAREAAPAGGVVVATTIAAAAGLVAMAARFADDLEDGQELAAAADRTRDESLDLGEQDAVAYGEVLRAARSAQDGDRRQRIRAALTTAAEVPLGMIARAQDVGRLAARLAREGNPNLRGDALTALTLAEAAARSAALLVRLNVEAGALDPDLLSRAWGGCRDLAAELDGALGE
ncbi:cyclodeaminase/cyclohydrolase family protein [Egicoccus sp. AB-alg2]|uniref:cyclodeaminase/cyclohydrolase family protein n=1 Tax=Egicoccus sp. AB-alg2 TaxID=3242693 RepID=UPI00359D89F1